MEIGGPKEFTKAFDISFAYMPVLGRSRKAFNEQDPIRYSTLELLSSEITNRNVAGNIAEVGVYQGDTLLYMHLCMPDKTLYAYDTFDGFNESAF